ncbi:MAG: DUF924 family protein [Acetobacteraceae bacterium]
MTGENQDAATAERRGAADVIAFWRAAGPEKWFGRDPGFDAAFREEFRVLHMAVAARQQDSWLATADGALALILLTDQYPRNAFRGTAHMYATDALARHYAREAEVAGHWQHVALELRLFLWLPFSHSEDLADQDHSVALNERFDRPLGEYAEGHRKIIRQFGRFPHRNAMLARETSAEEARFLAAGGFAG